VIVRRFVAKVHPDYGTLGWQPTWMPEADPLGGMAVAHDVLEHFPGDRGDAQGEFEALGAALWVRGQGHWWATYTPQIYTDPGHNLGAEYPDILMHVAYEGHGLEPPKALGSRPLDAEVEEWISEAWRTGRDGLEAGDPLFEPELEPIVRQLVRRGYRRARRRYRGCSPWDLAWLFDQIRRRAEEERDRREEADEQGAELVVRVRLRGPRGFDADVRAFDPGEPGREVAAHVCTEGARTPVE